MGHSRGKEAHSALGGPPLGCHQRTHVPSAGTTAALSRSPANAVATAIAPPTATTTAAPTVTVAHRHPPPHDRALPLPRLQPNQAASSAANGSVAVTKANAPMAAAESTAGEAAAGAKAVAATAASGATAPARQPMRTGSRGAPLPRRAPWPCRRRAAQTAPVRSLDAPPLADVDPCRRASYSSPSLSTAQQPSKISQRLSPSPMLSHLPSRRPHVLPGSTGTVLSPNSRPRRWGLGSAGAVARSVARSPPTKLLATFGGGVGTDTNSAICGAGSVAQHPGTGTPRRAAEKGAVSTMSVDNNPFGCCRISPPTETTACHSSRPNRSNRSVEPAAAATTAASPTATRAPRWSTISGARSPASGVWLPSTTAPGTQGGSATDDPAACANPMANTAAWEAARARNQEAGLRAMAPSCTLARCGVKRLASAAAAAIARSMRALKSDGPPGSASATGPSHVDGAVASSAIHTTGSRPTVVATTTVDRMTQPEKAVASAAVITATAAAAASATIPPHPDAGAPATSTCHAAAWSTTPPVTDAARAVPITTAAATPARRPSADRRSAGRERAAGWAPRSVARR